jgi:Zn-dependent metalloprotease
MNRTCYRPASLLLAMAICLAGAAPSAAAAAPHDAVTSSPIPSSMVMTPARTAQVTQALDQLTANRAQMGLGRRDAFAVVDAFTNGQGETIVHLNHTYAGQRVWGSQAIAHVLLDWSVRPLTGGVQANIALTGAPPVSPAAAVDIVVKRLAPRGPLSDPPEVELVVFPLEHSMFVRLEADSTGGPTFQEIRDVMSHLPSGQSTVWAYEVRTGLSRAADGFKEMTYIVEGNTGAVLQAFDRLESLAASPPAFSAPAVGTGHGFYRGTVSVNTTLLADGTYLLWDTTRGSTTNASLTNGRLGWYPYWSSGDAITKWLYKSPGIAVLAGQYDGPLMNPYTIGVNPWPFFNPTNNWGDGLAWLGDYANPRTPNGQTLAVDAMSALATTFDFYKSVLGYDGWDGKGGSIFAIAGFTNMDNAFWAPSYTGIFLGGGSYPANPNGFLPLTDMDIVSHEYGHGITNKVGFYNGAGFESGGLAEGTSDILAQMVLTWTGRAAADPIGSVPSTGASWEIGRGAGRGTPLRWMDKPSRDGISPDASYGGVGYMDPHFSMGVTNRFFYFLSQGASATPGDPHYSSYLPGGMTGIGNDAALRIWFKTATERLTSMGVFAAARDASIAAANDLIAAGTIPAGADVAVENAWAAVNVGSAHGAPPRVRVSFFRDSPYLDSLFLLFRNIPVVPAGEPVLLPIKVENSADTRVVWTVGGPSHFAGDSYNLVGGKVDAEGRWTSPLNDLWSSQRFQPHLYRMTATSKADPSQFADGLVFAAFIDTDGDGERDALDLAGVAFSWGLGYAVAMSHSVFPASTYVNDWDTACIVQAIRTAWPVK